MGYDTPMMHALSAAAMSYTYSCQESDGRQAASVSSMIFGMIMGWRKRCKLVYNLPERALDRTVFGELTRAAPCNLTMAEEQYPDA